MLSKFVVDRVDRWMYIVDGGSHFSWNKFDSNKPKVLDLKVKAYGVKVEK